jgi:hypothetical protein
MEPESVDAQVGIAWMLDERVANGLSKTREQDLQRADQLLDEAYDRDRNDIRAVTEVGRLRRLQGHLVESGIELERALSLNPNNSYAISYAGITNLFLGRPDAALPELPRFARAGRSGIGAEQKLTLGIGRFRFCPKAAHDEFGWS